MTPIKSFKTLNSQHLTHHNLLDVVQTVAQSAQRPDFLEKIPLGFDTSTTVSGAWATGVLFAGLKAEDDSKIVVFIDPSVPDSEILQAGVVEGVEAIALNPNQDGIKQITTVLRQHPEITTIHIVSHGAPGCLYLGNSQLNWQNIHKYAEYLQNWQRTNGNLSIYLYGCNVAAGDAGEEFIAKLHQITRAKIAASAKRIGNVALGGSWELEVSTPTKIAPSLAFCADTLAIYQGVFTPTLVGEWNQFGYAFGVQVVGNYAYVAYTDSGLQIIDISNPTTPILKGSYDTNGSAWDVQVVGNYAYVADYDSGLQIIDISNPTTPTFKGNYDTNGDARGVQVVGNYAYVADDYAGLRIIDISNPTTPILKGNYDTNGRAWGVQVVGNYAYVADFSSGLQIIDISNPTTPILKGNYDTNGFARGVQVVGNYAYVADQQSGLQIIDINNPTTPILKGNYDTNGSAWGVQVVGNYAYVADQQSGLQIIDISNPTTPILKDNYDTNGFARGVQVVGNYAYVADDSGGLKIIDVSEFTGNSNQVPTNLTLSNSNISENQAIGTLIGNFTTTDPDVGNTFTYSLVTGTGSTDNSLFTISNNQLKTNAIFDYETKNSYSLRVRTTDQDGLFYEKELTIDVTNINEIPTNLTVSQSTVGENQAIGTLIGNFTTTDPDVGNTFTYSLVTGTGSTDNSLFTISNNQLKTNAIFDYETKNSYSLRVRTTDQDGLFYEKELTIGVTNINETPTNLTVSQSTVAENQAIGTVIGNFITTDPDPSNTFTYSLVTGTGATDNSLFTISNNQLKTNAIFDYETKNSYSLRVRTTDQGGLFYEKELTIGIDSFVPGDLSFSSPQFTVNEDGTPIAAVTVTRSGGSDGAVSATINFKDGTAKAPSDYNNTPIAVNFTNGEIGKTVIIPIVNDTKLEPNETLQLLLVNPTGGATIGQQNSATLTIIDKNAPLIIGFPQGASGSNKGQTTIVIAGQNFSPTDQISLIAPNGTEKAASKVYWVNETEAWATFDLQGLSTGEYDVKVKNELNSSVSNDSFTVTARAAGNIQVKLSYPARDFVTVSYVNVGQTDVIAPLLRISATNAQITYPEDDTISATLRQLLNLTLGASNNSGPVGILAPGESGEFSFAYTPNDNGLISFAVEQVKPNEVINWASIKAESRAEYSFIDAAAWDAIWSNLTAAVGTTVGQFQAVMTENANYLSQLGQPTNDLTRLFAFEWKQAVNTLTNVDLLSTTDVVDAAPGLSLTFNRIFHQSIAERYNLGSLGRGWSSQWDLRATTDTKGNVVIRSVGDLQRVFEKQTNGTYTENGGAILTITNGQYSLKESSGLVSLFGTDGKLSYVEDTNANRITLEYTNNNLTKLVHTNGDSLTLDYNAQGRISQISDSTAQVTSYSYDATGETLLSVTASDGTITYSYDTGSVAAKKYSILSVTSDLGYQRSFEYDNQGRLTKEFSNGETQALTYSYDSVGGVTITDSTGASQTILLDDRGNGGQIRGVNNQNLLFSYDADGNLTSATLPNGGQTGYIYDSKGNLTQQTNLLGRSTKFTYDATFNRLTSFTDPNGNGVSYSYDANSNLTKITYPDGSFQQYGVDALGNITSAINRRGNTIQYTYNTSGLLTKKQYADGSNVAYSYDTKGNVISVIDGTGTIAMQYDAANQLTKITYPTGRSLTYTYNADGQRTKLVSQDGYTVNYTYDTVGRLKTLNNGTGQSIISYDYDSAGRLIKETNGNETYTTYQYDQQSQLTRLTNYKADNTINSRFEYAYDNLGQRTSMTTLDGTFQYGYDATGQLTSVVTPTNRTINYQYDAAGNRIEVIDNATTTNYARNNLNEYTYVGNAVYTYDADGNLIGKTEGGQTSTYTYDVENRLVKVVTPDGTWDYQYDGLGNRVATVLNGQRTEYLLDPTGLGDIVGEYNNSGNLVANYDYGIGLVSRVNGSNSNYYDADAIGSTIGLTGTDGSYVNSYSYLPFGEDLTKVEGVANPFEYVGQWGVMDEGNGLDFMRSRFYDSSLGRFTAADPIGLNGGDTNFYRYVGNSPLNRFDPSGLLSLDAGCSITVGCCATVGPSFGFGAGAGTMGFGGASIGCGVSVGCGISLCTDDTVSPSLFPPAPPDNSPAPPYNCEPDNPFDLTQLPIPCHPAPFSSEPPEPPEPPTPPTPPPTPPPGPGTYNDPHLQTLDGIHYDFQTVGEFTLVKSTTDDFEIQTRQQPWNSSTSASANSAIAVKIGGQRIAIYANQTNTLLINGTAVTLPQAGLYAVGQNLIIREGSQYSIFTANNDLILIKNRGTFLNINLGLADNRQGKVVGLLGNYNNTENDEFALRDGTAIGGTITNQQLYGDYAASWRITQATSLFDYALGQNSSTFTDLTFPKNIVTAATLTPEQRATAELIARNAGITDPNVLEDVILDIFISNGNTDLIQAAINGATDQQRIETVSAPNTLINPDGFGTQHYLTANAVIPYAIRFTNNAVAGTTPVAEVSITQTLDSDIDLNTFTLNSFGFGDISVNVPTGLQNYSQRLDLRSTRGVYVDVNAGLDKSTGIVTWTFAAIDPITGNAANSVTQGFLPPNDQNGVGSGFVGYSVQPKANPTNNTRIDAQASITFNSQTPIQTNPVFNTLDTDIPTSQINALPANSNANFTVSWTGSDNGSGIATYDIYAATNGSQYVLWKDDITDISATYNGQVGSSYAFYSVATDNLGLTEAAPTQFDATTTILIAGNNSPTVQQAIINQTATEDITFSFILPENTFADIDNDILTYSATLENDNLFPSWLTFNSTTRTFSGTPTNDNVGSLNIKVTATDNSGASVNDKFTLTVANTNDAPNLQNAISDQLAKEDIAFSFTFDANTFIDIDAGDNLTYSATLEDGSNLPNWLKFNVATRTFSGIATKTDLASLIIKVIATDNKGLSAIDTFALAVEQNNNVPTFQLSKIADDIFNISNSSGKSKIKITLTERNSNLVNELGVFTVDDAEGKINGIAPGTAGYTQAALERSQVIFSAISNLPNGFNSNNLTHLLEFNSGENLRFYLVKNSTIDAVRTGVTPLTDILFSDPLTQKITDLGNDDFSLAWKDGSGNSAANFNNLVVKFSSTNDSLPLGTNLQGKPQGEVIDLRGITSQVKADFVVNREAAFNNFIGFYQVADESGGIDSNGDGKADIFAGQAGYIEAAIRGRVAGIELTVNNQGTATYTGTFQPGTIFAPFIIANGRPDALLDSNPNNNPAVYFPFLGANADKVDHIRLLGNNIFGFEDLPTGGDKDFNDVIVRVNLSIA